LRRAAERYRDIAAERGLAEVLSGEPVVEESPVADDELERLLELWSAEFLHGAGTKVTSDVEIAEQIIKELTGDHEQEPSEEESERMDDPYPDEEAKPETSPPERPEDKEA
jgi:hypothetical protein